MDDFYDTDRSFSYRIDAHIQRSQGIIVIQKTKIKETD